MDVLVADDDVTWRESIRRTLERNGYKVTLAVNGAKAIECLDDRKFDLLITDVFMPEKEGLEVIEEVRRRLFDIRIIAISSGGAVGHSSYLRMAEAFGANISLQKPFTALHLLDCVSVASRYRPSEAVPDWDRPRREHIEPVGNFRSRPH